MAAARTNTSYTFTNLAKGKEYRYKIRAVEGPADNEQFSKPAPASSPWYVGVVIKPPAPTGLTATAGGRSVTLSWDAATVASVTGYAYRVNHNDTGHRQYDGLE